MHVKMASLGLNELTTGTFFYFAVMQPSGWKSQNKQVSQMRVPQAACCKPAGGPEQAAKCATCF